MESDRKPDLTAANAPLRPLQLNELSMLIEVDRICRKNQIEYSIDGGTLLGAVRHRGFIPWDDDADLMMTRKEYLRFREACEKDMDHDRFFLQDHTTDREYPWGYEKIRLVGSELIRPGQEHMGYRTGIYIDLFVLDHVPDGPAERQIFRFMSFVIRKLLYSELGMKAEKTRSGRLFYRFCYKSIDRASVFRLRDRMVGATNMKKTKLVSHITWPYPNGNQYGVPARFFDEYTDILFEGYTLRCIKAYDAYLRLLYNDYMQLPPPEERKPKLKMSGLKTVPLNELFSQKELERFGTRA